MREETKKNNKRFSPAGRAIIGISLSLAIIIAMTNIGVYTWAKYHSEDSGKGVATVSSDFFFMSNTLNTVESIEWANSNKITEAEAIDELHKFDYIYGESDWTATTPCAFNIEMHNYENTLRYNAETIEYKLYVQMLDTPSNPKDKYEFIRYSDDHSQELARYDITDGKMLVIENLVLEGDAANKNYFSLLVNPANSDDYIPANVIVYAEITSPDYIDSASYYLGGIFSPQAERLSFRVNGSFDIEAEIEAGHEWLDALNDLSGYAYSVETDGEADAEHDLILYWNGEYFDFDLHNSYYTEKTVLNSDNTFKERIPIEYDGFIERGKVEDLPEERRIEGYTDYLIYHIAANRVSTFIFYKGEKWDTDGLTTDENDEIILKPASYDEFKKLAKVQLY